MANQKVLLRSLGVTSAYVETDIKDENGNYKPYSIPDSIDSSLLTKKIQPEPQRPRSTLRVDLEEVKKMFSSDPYKELWDNLKRTAK